jgi:hypothetical protein
MIKMKIKFIIMKKTKFLLLIILSLILFAAGESYAHPRYRTCRVVHRVYPSYYSGYTTTYYIVKKPKIIIRHHKKIVHRVIYY